MTTIARGDLYEKLVHSPVIQQLQAKAPVDVAAVAMGLAQVESNYQLDAQGDKDASGRPHALGLWQFNVDAWKVDPLRITDLDYQIGLFGQVFAQADGAVRAGLATIGQRKTAGESIEYAPARDLAHWYNVAWQYGAGGIAAWLAKGADLSVAGFKAFRASIGKPVDDALPLRRYSARAASFRSRYDQVEADAPDFWRSVVGGTVIGATAVAVSIAAGPAIAAGGIAYDAGHELGDRIPNPSSWWNDLAKRLEGLALFGAVLSGLVVAATLWGVWILYRVERKVTRAA